MVQLCSDLFHATCLARLIEIDFVRRCQLFHEVKLLGSSGHATYSSYIARTGELSQPIIILRLMNNVYYIHVTKIVMCQQKACFTFILLLLSKYYNILHTPKTSG